MSNCWVPQPSARSAGCWFDTCGRAAAAWPQVGAQKTKHIAVVSQRRALIAESQTAKHIITYYNIGNILGMYVYIRIHSHY